MNVALRVAKQALAATKRPTECSLGCGRLQNRLRQLPLIFQRKTHDLRLFNRSASRFMSGCDDEVRQATPLNLRGALEKLVHVRGQACFEASRGGFMSHLFRDTAYCRTRQRRQLVGVTMCARRGGRGAQRAPGLRWRR